MQRGPVQRILERGQIESLGTPEMQRVRRPVRAEVFAARSRRLRVLSVGHSIDGYLRAMSELTQAQHESLQQWAETPVSIERAVGVEPPLDPQACIESEQFPAILDDLCARMVSRPDAGDAVRAVCERLRTSDRAWLTAQARALLELDDASVDVAAAPFIMAALQVCCTLAASSLDDSRVSMPVATHQCPVCGGAAVASVIRTDAKASGHRFLACAVCASEWHFLRAACSHCGSAKRVNYQAIEGAGKAIRAECCDECGVYRKVFNREVEPNLEAVADDLGSIELDLLVGEAGYRRASGNPLFWQA